MSGSMWQVYPGNVRVWCPVTGCEWWREAPAVSTDWMLHERADHMAATHAAHLAAQRPTPACPYRAHYGEPCDCEARLAAVVTHTRTSTPVGPNYCVECSEAVSEWMPWPCPATRPTPAPTEES